MSETTTSETSGHPVEPDRDVSEVFWEACEREELWVQYCTACDTWQHYPRSLCSHCWAPASALRWRFPSGRAQVESFSVVHRGSGAFAPYAPYAVALVRLAEGPVMMTHVVGDIEAVAIGDTVQLEFAERAGRTVPVFRAGGSDG